MIVSLYDKLMAVRSSPVVVLSRAIASGQRERPQGGLEEIDAIANSERLASYPFDHAALGEFEFRTGRHELGREHFQTALAFARNPIEMRFIEQCIAACEQAVSQHAMRRQATRNQWLLFRRKLELVKVRSRG